MIQVICLLTGGAAGTLSRYLLSTWVQRLTLSPFPAGILCVNAVGSFLIGFCWSLAEAFHFPATMRTFLFVGFFGGFTTFSSFSLDTLMLMKSGAYKLAFINILANNGLGLAAVFLGILLGKNTVNLIK